MTATAPRAASPRPIRTSLGRMGCSRRREPWRGAAPGFGIWESRLSCSGANDARAGEAIVETAIVAAEQRRDETEARRDGQQQPHELSQEGVAKIERARFG